MTEIDGFIVTAEVEQLTGYTRRWIAEKVKANTFPAPDVPGRIGSAHRWRRSTIQRWLDDTVESAKQARKGDLDGHSAGPEDHDSRAIVHSAKQAHRSKAAPTQAV